MFVFSLHSLLHCSCLPLCSHLVLLPRLLPPFPHCRRPLALEHRRRNLFDARDRLATADEFDYVGEGSRVGCWGFSCGCCGCGGFGIGAGHSSRWRGWIRRGKRVQDIGGNASCGGRGRRREVACRAVGFVSREIDGGIVFSVGVVSGLCLSVVRTLLRARAELCWVVCCGVLYCLVLYCAFI